MRAGVVVRVYRLAFPGLGHDVLSDARRPLTYPAFPFSAVVVGHLVDDGVVEPVRSIGAGRHDDVTAGISGPTAELAEEQPNDRNGQRQSDQLLHAADGVLKAVHAARRPRQRVDDDQGHLARQRQCDDALLHDDTERVCPSIARRTASIPFAESARLRRRRSLSSMPSLIHAASRARPACAMRNCLCPPHCPRFACKIPLRRTSLRFVQPVMEPGFGQ